MSENQEHENRQLGGYKAALHNPNVSAEAKEHVTARLQEHGIPVDESHASHIPAHDQAHHDEVTRNQGHSFEHHSAYHTRHGEDKHKDQGHVIGGYKATLSNPNTSNEAKEHAREQLKALGVEA